MIPVLLDHPEKDAALGARAAPSFLEITLGSILHESRTP